MHVKTRLSSLNKALKAAAEAAPLNLWPRDLVFLFLAFADPLGIKEINGSGGGFYKVWTRGNTNIIWEWEYCSIIPACCY